MLAARLDCVFPIGCPQAQWKFDSPVDAVSMFEVLLKLREPDFIDLNQGDFRQIMKNIFCTVAHRRALEINVAGG